MTTIQQKQLLNFIGDREVSKKEIVEEFGGLYFRNGSFHIGQRLSRMVNSKLLIRVRRGVFKVNKSPILGTKKEVVAENQISMFN